MNSIMMVLEAILLGSLLVMSAGAFTTSTALSSRSNAFQKAHDSTTFLFSSNSKMPYDDDKMRFYALGLNLGQQVGGSVVPILKEKELDICLEAFGDQLRGTATQDARTILETFGPQLNQIIQERANLLIDGNKKAGEAFQTKFLEDNPDAVKQESGLIYLETEQGKGESPTIESMVEVDYHGTLACGTVIDSSIERGQPMNFPLKDVIKGWGEGLQLMKEGGTFTRMAVIKRFHFGWSH